MSLNSLHSPGWPWTKDLLVSVSKLIGGVHVHSRILSFSILFNFPHLLNFMDIICLSFSVIYIYILVGLDRTYLPQNSCVEVLVLSAILRGEDAEK